MRLAVIVTTAAFLIVSCKSKDKKMEDHGKHPASATKAEKSAAKDGKKAEASAAAPSESASSAAKVECKNGGETRVLEVRGKDKGCETAYTKGGTESVVGSSQNGTAHCEGIVTRIKDKLVAAGYTCE